MTRILSIMFEVDDDTVTDEALYELADRIVTLIDPDPPVLTFDGVRIDPEQSTRR